MTHPVFDRHRKMAEAFLREADWCESATGDIWREDVEKLAQVFASVEGEAMERAAKSLAEKAEKDLDPIDSIIIGACAVHVRSLISDGESK